MTGRRRPRLLLLLAASPATAQSPGPPALTNDEPPQVQQNAIPPPEQGRKRMIGAAVDRTGDIRDRMFTLATAIGAVPIGGVPATGNKLTGEADIAYTFPLLGHPTTVEAKALYARFSGDADVGGGYAMVQVLLFDTPRIGDLDLFACYAPVTLGSAGIARRAT